MARSDQLVSWIFGAALAIRLFFTVLGEIWDAVDPVRRYTDVDYIVFTDAAREVVDGRSPFDRATYRYTPLLAWMMLPNVTLLFSYGKFVFAGVDMLIGWLIFRILTLRGVTPRAAALYSCAFLFHPFVINISTRGSADALVCSFVLLALYLILIRREFLSAVCFGLAVHLKIYPIIYALPFVLFLDKDYVPEDFPASTPALALDGVEGASETALSRARSSDAKTNPSSSSRSLTSSSSSSSSSPSSRSSSPFSGFSSATPALASSSSTPSSSSSSSSSSMTSALSLSRQSVGALVCAGVRWLREFLTWRRIRFGLVSGGVFFLLTGLFYAMYGYEFLYETYLYHFVRTDNRHNFSVYFYDLYLRYDRPSRTGVGLVSFIPQFGTVLLLGARFYKDLPFCLTLQTLAFVTFNKVCTAQYFLWYLCLLPLALPSCGLSFRTGWLPLIASWIGSEVHWLFWASQLEQEGKSTFLQVWLAGVVFFVANLWAIRQILTHHRFLPVFANGQLVQFDSWSHSGPFLDSLSRADQFFRSWFLSKGDAVHAADQSFAASALASSSSSSSASGFSASSDDALRLTSSLSSAGTSGPNGLGSFAEEGCASPGDDRTEFEFKGRRDRRPSIPQRRS